jgi:hypothetical protein
MLTVRIDLGSTGWLALREPVGNSRGMPFSKSGVEMMKMIRSTKARSRSGVTLSSAMAVWPERWE